MPKTVNIRSFLPQREIEICERLREIRKAAKLQQSEFAATVGISRERLASYEYAKAPVRYEVGKQACYRFNFNQRWLATGQLPKQPYFDISPHTEFEIKPRGLFSEAFDRVLKGPVEQRGAELEKVVGQKAWLEGEFEPALLDNYALVGEEPAKALAFYIRSAVGMHLKLLPPKLQHEYASALLNVAKKFTDKHWPAILEHRKAMDALRAKK